MKRTGTIAEAHTLKCWPEFFAAIVDGSKPFEVRKDDRGFAVGDWLELREWDPETQAATGRHTLRAVTYVLRGGQFGVEAGHVVMGLR